MTVCCPCGVVYDVTVAALSIARCPSCGTGATIPPPRRDVYSDGLFDDADAGYGGRRMDLQAQWFHEAEVRLAWLHRTVPRDACLLEIGAATGEFVVVAERAGHVVTGLETSPGAVAAAAAVTTRVRPTDLQGWRAGAEGQEVDAVAMFHVLEHVPDPVALLTDIRGVLRPGGTLHLEVPNGGSFAARTLGVRWWAARTEDHFFHFSARGLRASLTRAGFEVDHIRAVHRDVYVDRGTRWRGAAKDAVRPLVGRGRRSYDLLRAVARS